MAGKSSQNQLIFAVAFDSGVDGADLRIIEKHLPLGSSDNDSFVGFEFESLVGPGCDFKKNDHMSILGVLWCRFNGLMLELGPKPC